MNFCLISISRLATLSGLAKNTLSELVCLLTETVHKDVQTCSASENCLLRRNQSVEANTDEQKVVLVSASNLRS
jgi:hypothetical protein